LLSKSGIGIHILLSPVLNLPVIILAFPVGVAVVEANNKLALII
jgi:hypothetical protein